MKIVYGTNEFNGVMHGIAMLCTIYIGVYGNSFPKFPWSFYANGRCFHPPLDASPAELPSGSRLIKDGRNNFCRFMINLPANIIIAQCLPPRITINVPLGQLQSYSAEGGPRLMDIV